jgi:hypothetical protein
VVFIVATQTGVGKAAGLLFDSLILDFSGVTDKECSSIDNSSTANSNGDSKLYSIGEFDENCCTEKLLPAMANAQHAGCGKRS